MRSARKLGANGRRFSRHVVCAAIVASSLPSIYDRKKRGSLMGTRNWIIGAVVVVVVIVIGYFALGPAGEAPTAGIEAPATTEQTTAPAGDGEPAQTN